MPTGMFIAFEGIDGSGKTTLSNRVAASAARTGPHRRARARGGRFASRVTQAIRDFCRDARNLALVPRAELLLYVAREIQLAEEVVIPGARARRRRHHRSLPVHGGGAGAADSPPAGRDDSRDHRRRAPAGVARDGVPRRRRPIGRARPPQGREADDARAPARARARGWPAAARAAAARRLSRARGARSRPLDRRRQHRCRSGRAGGCDICDASEGARARRAGGGRERAHRARRTAPARRDTTTRPRSPPPRRRWPRSSPGSTTRATRADARGLRAGGAIGPGRRRAAAGARGTSAAGDRARPARAVRRRVVAAAAVARRGGAARGRAVARPTRRPRRRRPGCCASCWPRSRRPRSRRACEGLDDETAWALRDQLYDRVPDAVLASLALLDSPRAWRWRERWIARARHARTPPSPAT